MNSNEMHVCCDDFIHCKNFPMDKIINLHPLRSSNKHKRDDEHACFNCLFWFVFTININCIKIMLNLGQTFPLTTWRVLAGCSASLRRNISPLSIDIFLKNKQDLKFSWITFLICAIKLKKINSCFFYSAQKDTRRHHVVTWYSDW